MRWRGCIEGEAHLDDRPGDGRQRRTPGAERRAGDHRLVLWRVEVALTLAVISSASLRAETEVLIEVCNEVSIEW